MPSFQREDTNFSKYIQEYCQLPKYKNEKYLPVMVSRRVDDEFFAVMAMPYGLTNDYIIMKHRKINGRLFIGKRLIRKNRKIK